MGDAIEQAGGQVDKFMGDGVMALFGLDGDGPLACRRALNAARLMSLALVELNQALAPDLDAPLAMGVGLHFGAAIVGEMGYGGRRSLTAIGDTINTASRLEELCKAYNCELVLSEDVLACSGLVLTGADRRHIEIRGHTMPLTINVIKRARELALTPPEGAAPPVPAVFTLS